MNADELRAPLSEREAEALDRTCAESGVPRKVSDPVAISAAATVLRRVGDRRDRK